tara:strand:+ start:100 stop:234 length:135 start_codon:yes stop_codon:yes gene_type:complete
MQEIMIAEKIDDMSKEEIMDVFRDWCMEHPDAASELLEKLEDVI